jgi:hypothetical protein
MSEKENTEGELGVSAKQVQAYLAEVYQQLDAISFNIRTNIQNMNQGAKDGNANKE